MKLEAVFASLPFRVLLLVGGGIRQGSSMSNKPLSSSGRRGRLASFADEVACISFCYAVWLQMRETGRPAWRLAKLGFAVWFAEPHAEPLGCEVADWPC